MMHRHGPGMMHWRGMLMHEIMEKIPDDQKKVILKRIIDGKILLRENRIKQMQFKIETMKMIRKMIDEC
ncbi:MAG TPA: hypothetical protein PK272_02165 [Methanoregulaceae archaeon]|nr:hypothetical protein [Methanoregulaceae archaeon]HNI41454.1 hypothetical protein [Methanoregulaceae archaeon]HOH81410.1 hypothetical protein [Methanoregulaceae archaeon]HPA09166.1 hypothetical protein [Methanoregulaceae archaeon]